MFFRTRLNDVSSFDLVGKGSFTLVVKVPACTMISDGVPTPIDYVLRIPIKPTPSDELDYLFRPTRIMRVWSEVNPDSPCGAIVELPLTVYRDIRCRFKLDAVEDTHESTVFLSALPFLTGSEMDDLDLSRFASSIYCRTGRLVIDLASRGNAVRLPDGSVVLRDVDFALKLICEDRAQGEREGEGEQEGEEEEVSISRGYAKTMVLDYCEYYYKHFHSGFGKHLTRFLLMMLSQQGLMPISVESVRSSFPNYLSYYLWAVEIVSSSSSLSTERLVRLLFELSSSYQGMIARKSAVLSISSVIRLLSQQLPSLVDWLNIAPLDEFRLFVHTLISHYDCHRFFTRDDCYRALCDRLYQESAEVVVLELQDWFRLLARKKGGQLLQLEKFILMHSDFKNQFIVAKFPEFTDFIASLTIAGSEQFRLQQVIESLSFLDSLSAAWSELSPAQLENILVFLFEQHCVTRVVFSLVANSAAMNTFLSLSLPPELVVDVMKAIQFDSSVQSNRLLTGAIESYQGAIAESVRVGLLALVSPECSLGVLNALLSDAFQDKGIYRRLLSRLTTEQRDQLSQPAQRQFIEDMKCYYDSCCTVSFYNASRHRFSLFSDSQRALSQSILNLQNHVATTEHDGASRQTVQRYQLLPVSR